MPASSTDYDDLAATGLTIEEQWPSLYSLLGGFIFLLAAKQVTGSEPVDYLEGWIFGQADWRLIHSGGDLLVQENTAVAPAETWVTRATFAAGTGLSLAAAAITSGVFADSLVQESNVTQHEAAIDHDALTGFVANEHIDHSGVAIAAGTGLTGGGAINANRTLNLADTAVTPGTYGGQNVSLTVDQQGRITAASGSPGSTETYDEATGGDITLNTSFQLVPWDNADVGDGLLFPGADGVKDYYYQIQLEWVGGNNTSEYEIRKGTTGVEATDTTVLDKQQSTASTSWVEPLSMFGKVLAPTALEVLSLAARTTSGGGTVRAGTTSTQRVKIRIWEVPA